LFGASVLNYIIAARTAQGFEDARTSTPEERQDIISRWTEHKDEYQNARQKIQEQGGPEGQESGHLSPRGFLQTRHLSFDERKRLHEERKKKREEEREKVHGANGSSCPFCRRAFAHKHTPRPVQETPVVPNGVHATADVTGTDFEQAIHTSVAATSRGDPEEDMMIERAIRASLRELQNAQGSTISDEEALERAIKASVAEAARRHSADVTSLENSHEDDSEHRALLENAIQKSLMEYQLPPRTEEPIEVHDDDDVDTDEDEDVKLAIKNSKEEEASRPKTEEEIVLEYVKKQSLAEEEHRRKIEGKRKEGSMTDADEEALKAAIAASLETEA